MAIYSHSKLSTFEQCSYKYKLRYIDKIIPEIEMSIEAHLGKCVHDTLEWIYYQVKEKQIPTIDQAITYYSNIWQEKFKQEFTIVKKELTAKDYFNKGVEFLLTYYMENAPFNDGTIELEKKILVRLTENHQIIGFIDRLAYNPEKDRYEIHDYKTGNSLPSQDKFEKDRQLALYAIAIKEEMGQEKEVVLIWHYLAHNKKIISQRTNSQLEQLKKDTIELIKKIELATEFPPNRSLLCEWCEYKSLCPTFNTIKPPTIQTNLDNFPTAKKYIID